jgi:hypothetical protein
MPGWGQLLEHEQMRWGYMDDRKLLTRLRRIKKREKLECFIFVAERENNETLLRAAYNRAMELGFASLVSIPDRLPATPVADDVPDWKKPEKEKNGIRVIRFRKDKK